MRWRLGANLGEASPYVLAVTGGASVAVGAYLLADPLVALRLLVVLVGAGLLVTGGAELLRAPDARWPWLRRAAGVAWLVGGVVALAWPGATVWVLALAAGTSLAVGGALEVVAAARDAAGAREDRLIDGLNGTTSLLVGLLALAWPGVTLLVVAVLVGLRSVLFGLGLLWRAGRHRRRTDRAARRWPLAVRASGAVAGLALAVGVTALSVAVHRAQPGEPGAFYTPPDPLPTAEPGTVLRTEVLEGYVEGATTHRVLYLSTDLDGEPTAVSGLVFVPDGPAPPGGRAVIAYTHGTVGVTPRCAPSLQEESNHPLFIEGGRELLAEGYVIAASDYQGLGTPGTHPYLVGAVEARNALDSVRAAQQVPDAQTSDRVVVWGHSQGGHAALFTGQEAADYAPELEILGVAAGGPVPDLVALFAVNVETDVGRVLIAMAMQAWADTYDAARLDQVVTPAARPVVGRIARNCLYGTGQVLGSLPASLVLKLTFLNQPPWDTEPWRTIARTNTPGDRPIGVPLLVVQGTADQIIAPELTDAYVADRCAAGEVVSLLELPGVGHLETGIEAIPEVVAWIADRVAGTPAPTTCP